MIPLSEAIILGSCAVSAALGIQTGSCEGVSISNKDLFQNKELWWVLLKAGGEHLHHELPFYDIFCRKDQLVCSSFSGVRA